MGISSSGRLAFTALLAVYIEAHRREATLLATRNDLETRDQARTRELAQANQDLRAEIAERKRAEASLCDAQARLRLALQASKEAESQLAQLALCDGLTGLANRRWIEDELERALIASRRNRQKIAVMFIDLDRFKDINDTLGHEAGDSLLKRVAERLRPEVRESDAVARLGGDEFIVILIDISRPEDAANVARKLLRTLSAPMNLGGSEIVISASIGISLSPEDGSDAKTLLRHADTALYRAKEAGKNDYCFYTALALRADTEGATQAV